MIASGEGVVARETQGFEHYLLMGLRARNSGWSRLVGVGQSAAAKVLVDGDAPAVKGGKGVADELRWSKAELLVSLGRAEQHRGGGSTESRSSPEMMGKERRCESPGKKSGRGFL